jgi:hypothetical protein
MVNFLTLYLESKLFAARCRYQDEGTEMVVMWVFFILPLLLTATEAELHHFFCKNDVVVVG